MSLRTIGSPVPWATRTSLRFATLVVMTQGRDEGVMCPVCDFQSPPQPFPVHPDVCPRCGLQLVRTRRVSSVAGTPFEATGAVRATATVTVDVVVDRLGALQRPDIERLQRVVAQAWWDESTPEDLSARVRAEVPGAGDAIIIFLAPAQLPPRAFWQRLLKILMILNLILSFGQNVDRLVHARFVGEIVNRVECELPDPPLFADDERLAD
jgi:hypothetical protein